MKFKTYFNQMSARIYENNPQGLKILLNNILRADFNKTKSSKTGQTLLHIAVQCESFDCVKLLLGKGININEQDNEGNTALHTAIVKSDTITDYLIKNGAN